MIGRIFATLMVSAGVTGIVGEVSAHTVMPNPVIFCGAIPPKMCHGLCAKNEFPTVLKVTKSGEIFWEGASVDAAALRKRLKPMRVEFSYFWIKADENAPYGVVARLILELQRRHYDSVLCEVPNGQAIIRN